MVKKLLMLICIFYTIPAIADELGTALAKNNNVFLYLYTPTCGYCQRFSPIYNKMSKMYDKHYGFVKVDASTMYGYQLMMTYGARYVPYVVMINSKSHKSKEIDGSCLLKTACVESEMTKFEKIR